MKILINRKPVLGPWGGGNLFVSSFCDFMRSKGHDVVHDFSEDLDLIFMQDPRYSDLGISINEISAFKQSHPSVKVVHRINECDARKGTSGVDAMLSECSKITDHTVFVSSWMRDYHLEKGWNCNETSVVYNGTNKDHFKPGKKLENGKINLVTHHWSDNPLKGADVYDALDAWVGVNTDFTFTYIGRYSRPLCNTVLIPPLSGKDLGHELSRYDIYISGSRFDPGPNHVIESIAAGLPTLVHFEGGGAAEFAGKHYAFRTFEELTSLIKNLPDQKNDLVPSSWEECMSNILNVLETTA